MKTSRDPRHKARIRLMQDLFSWDFRGQKNPETKEGQEIIRNLDQINKVIKKAAPEWPIEQINRIDLAILRLAIFELIIKKDAPFKAVIDEAIELAKEFGSETSPSFVNGALGNIVEEYKLEKKEEK